MLAYAMRLAWGWTRLLCEARKEREGVDIGPILLLVLCIYGMVEAFVGANDGDERLMVFGQIQAVLAWVLIVIEVILQGQ